MSWRIITDDGNGSAYHRGGSVRDVDSWLIGYGDEFPLIEKPSGARGAPPINALFYRDDLGVLYRYAASGWTDSNATGGYQPVSDDGSASDTAQLQAALSGATNGDTIIIKPGTYNTRSAPLTLSGVSGVRIIGEGQPKILFRSAFATAGGVSSQRAGIYATSCDDLVIQGLQFEGDQEPDIEKNIGPAVYLTQCSRPILRDLRLTYGSQLFLQDATATDKGLLATNCYSYGQRNACNPGPYSRIEGCEFELPTSAGWDRVGQLGSSHGIYLFAGRDHVTVENCTFRNIRTHGLKASGTSASITHLRAYGNRFLDCGGAFIFGADGALDADHTDAVFENNTIIDCANRAAGWFTGAAVTVLGSYGTQVRGNTIVYTRQTVTPNATKGIEAQRYYTGQTGGRTCEDVLIAENEIISRASGVTPGNIAAHGIILTEVIRPRVERNRIVSVGTSGISVLTDCSLAQVNHNSFQNVIVCIQATSVSGVEVVGNRMVRGANSSNDAHLRFVSCTGIEKADNQELTTSGYVALVESEA